MKMNSTTNKMDINLTGMWVSFFTAAGIPSDVSATYALTFAENRIQNDMLLDLNKEYLKEMGIVRMGDVIAILRHAKQAHESAARDKVLGAAPAPPGRVPVAAVAGRATVAQPASPASRILEHYTRNTGSPETAPLAGVKLKRKAAPEVRSTADMAIKKSRVIRFESPTHVAPAAKETLSKQTVFARLGTAEAVKAVKAARAASPPPPPPPPQPAPTAKQIYLRLGCKGATDQPAVPVHKDALKYEGILKASPPEKKLPVLTKKVFTVTTSKNSLRKIVATMRADETPVSVKDKLALPKAKSVKFSSQVQYKEIETVKKVEVPVKPKIIPQKLCNVFNKPERRLSMPAGESAGVKARLGQKSANNLTITRNVFNRLGA